VDSPVHRGSALAQGLIAAVLLILGVVGGAPLARATDICLDFVSGCSYTTDSGVGWYYSAAQRAFFKTPTSFQPLSDAPELQWSYVPTCDGNTPGGNADACTAALCTAPGGEPGVTFWVFSRPVDPPDVAWTITGTQCIPGEQRVDLADVEARVRQIIEDKFREIAEPRVTVAPEAGGLVNLPVLAWTSDPGEVTLDIEQPVPGQIRATPDFEWLWSNGTTSVGPGQPYSPGISPTATPDRYVHAVFRQRGDASVTLTVTWTGDVTVPGLPPVNIEPLVYTSPVSFSVREARAQLVDSYG
jgi:hypothetical protein